MLKVFTKTASRKLRAPEAAGISAEVKPPVPDATAFESLFRAYYSRLCHFAFRFVGSREETEELVQDVFVWIWQNRYTWNPTGSVQAYLYRAVRNQALNRLKHREVVHRSNKRPERESSLMTRSLEDEFQQQEQARAIQQALELLPPRCKLIFLMHRDDSLTYAEIAGVLQISQKTVETQMGRALRILRKALVGLLTVLLWLNF